jgi:hypothetical protein
VLKDNNVISGYVHDNIVKDVDWYGERVLGEVSLGGIIILVVIRTIQHNMLKVNFIYWLFIFRKSLLQAIPSNNLMEILHDSTGV